MDSFFHWQHIDTAAGAVSHPFDFEDFVATELGINIDGKSSNIRGSTVPNDVCKFFLRGYCARGQSCPNRHTKNERTVVCKHWLRGLCKKGELCEFLHEYNLRKMPECWFYSKYGECSNPECLYLHIDPNDKVRECAWYARGFCKHGARCRHKHVRKALCPLYLTGFCPKGPECPFGHPKYELPQSQNEQQQNDANVANQQQYEQAQQHFQQYQQHQQQPFQQKPGWRPLTEVTCFKCNEKGHYANQCPKRRNMGSMGPFSQQNQQQQDNVGRQIPTLVSS